MFPVISYISFQFQYFISSLVTNNYHNRYCMQYMGIRDIMRKHEAASSIEKHWRMEKMIGFSGFVVITFQLLYQSQTES